MSKTNKPVRKKKGNNPNGTGSPAIIKLSGSEEQKLQIVRKVLMDNYNWWVTGNRKVENAEQLEERLAHFFLTCIENGELPAVEKMALALGVHRQTIWDWEKGSRGPEFSYLIRNAKSMISAIEGELAMKGEIDKTVYIFRAKNFFGMSDRVEHKIDTKNPLEELDSKEAIEKRIKDSIVVDVDDYFIDEVDEQ